MRNPFESLNYCQHYHDGLKPKNLFFFILSIILRINVQNLSLFSAVESNEFKSIYHYPKAALPQKKLRGKSIPVLDCSFKGGMKVILGFEKNKFSKSIQPIE